MGTLSPLFTLVRSFFLVFLPEEQKCSQNTIRSYRKSLELLFDFVKERNSVALNEITFEMMDRNTVSEFLSYLETERNCSISTRNHRLHCIRAFFKYAAQEDITVIAHLEEIQKVKRAKQPETIFYFCRYYNTPYDITTSRLDFSVWKRMKNLAR